MVFGGAHLGADSHVDVLVRVPQAVLDHGIDEDCVAHPVTRARALEKVRRVGHRLHPARHGELVFARDDRVGGVHDGPHARAADLVEGDARDGLGNTRAERGLPRRGLADARLEHVSHDHLLDVRRRDSRLLERAADGRGPERRRRKG